MSIIFNFKEFSLTELDKEGAEYIAVEDKVKKYIKRMHKWYPEVTKIEEIYNRTLKQKFKEAKRR